MKNKKKSVKAKAKKSKPKAKVVVVKTSRRGKLTPTQKKKYNEAMADNDFWTQRSTHGRDKIFASPDLMLEESLKYFKWGKENPEKRAELVKYEGFAREQEVSLKRPYTMQGLCRFLGVNTAYFRQFKAGLRVKESEGKTTQMDKDFSTVITTIEEIVEEQQIAGALVGHFNANIISRLIGLVEKKDVTSDGAPIATPEIKVYNVGPPLSKSEDEVK